MWPEGHCHVRDFRPLLATHVFSCTHSINTMLTGSLWLWSAWRCMIEWYWKHNECCRPTKIVFQNDARYPHAKLRSWFFPWAVSSVSPDLNECSLSTDDCDVNADCVNTNGSFSCHCKNGYSGNGRTGNCQGQIRTTKRHASSWRFDFPRHRPQFKTFFLFHRTVWGLVQLKNKGQIYTKQRWIW